MAVKQTCICDRCGDVILESRTLLSVEGGPLRIHRPTIDLCGHCAESLSGWLSELKPARPAEVH